MEPPNEVPYLVYKEDGLKQRKLIPKEVVHHANTGNSSRCLVRLYKLYNSLCPTNRPANSFYLTPFVKPRYDCWYRASPMGHNKLADVIPRLMKSAGIKGYFTDHSLRVTAATRLYDAQLDDATIMSRTGHRSVDGVRAYKRTNTKLKQLSSSILHAQKTPARVTDCQKTDTACTDLVLVENNPPAVLSPSLPSLPVPVRPSLDPSAKPTSAMPSFGVPTFSFGNASSFTFNSNYGPGH